MAPSSSDTRGCVERLDRSYQELKSSHGEPGTAVASYIKELQAKCTLFQDKYTRAEGTIAHLQDEITRLRDNSSARLQEEGITRLERNQKRKREGKEL